MFYLVSSSVSFESSCLTPESLRNIIWGLWDVVCKFCTQLQSEQFFSVLISDTRTTICTDRKSCLYHRRIYLIRNNFKFYIQYLSLIRYVSVFVRKKNKSKTKNRFDIHRNIGENALSEILIVRHCVINHLEFNKE